MPRSSRYLCDGYTYHLTHRCHNRSFLLKFARDRNVYRQWLWKAAIRYKVPVYGYCITCNHVHLIVHANKAENVSAMMHLVAGASAQQYNRRKNREGSLWQHPYQCTAIEDGQHLLNCIRYVSMNMVRAGAVSRPSQWRWSGHDELTGQRSRYRILNIERLLNSLGISCADDLRRIYLEGIAKQVDKEYLSRKPEWTDAIAVGGKRFVEQIASNYDDRRIFSYTSFRDSECGEPWAVHESRASYD